MAVCLSACLALATAGQKAKDLARQAQQAERRGDALKAYLLYSQAAAADPQKREYWLRSQALRTRALAQSNALPANLSLKAEPSQAGAAEAPEPLPPITAEDLAEARRPMPPAELAGAPGKRSFDLRADPRSLFEQVSKSFGLDVVFDADYPSGPPLRFRIADVDFRTALRALEAATSSFLAPLSPKLAMVYKDTPQKRQEAEPVVAVTLSLPNAVSVQEAQELARSVQQALEIKRFAIDSAQRLVLIRDSASKVRAAQQLYEQLLARRAQVLIEVELIDASARKELNYGLNLPTATAMAFLGRRSAGATVRRAFGFRVIPEFIPGFSRFLVMGGGLSTVALAVADAAAFASQSQSTSYTLFRTQVRSVDGSAASVHIGDKYPIVTQQFIGVPSGVPAIATPSTFTFEDLGLALKVTPRIHSVREVTLQVEAEFKILGSGEGFNGIPVINTRKFASTVRLRNGEWAVLAGLMSAVEARTISGLPLFARAPVIRHLLASNTRSREEGEALVVIKPHLLDEPVDSSPPGLYTGTESRWLTVR